MIQIKSHTGLRGVAALFVVAYHLQYRTGHLPVEDATTFFRRSYLMVDLFFVLSGFIMAYVYDARRGAVMDRAAVKTFLLRRFIRIYPLHLLVLVTMVIFTIGLPIVYAAVGRPQPLGRPNHSLTLLLAQFILANAWLPGPNGWNIPSWSISAEVVAYLIFPLLVLFSAKARHVFSLLVTLGAIAFYLWGSDGPSLDITGGIRAPLRCLAGFGLGFVIHFNREIFSAFSKHAPTIAQLVALLWIIATMSMPCDDAWTIPGFAALIAFTWTDRGGVAAALGARTMLWLGDISYAVYITHISILTAFDFGWDRTIRHIIHDLRLERVLYLSGAFIVVIVSSALVHRHVEKPISKFLARRWLTTQTTAHIRA